MYSSFFQGHDTTTAGISWTLFLLGRHPEIQEQAAEEINALWPKGQALTLQTLNEMKLLERVIKESLRLFPSVPFISRELQEDMVIGKTFFEETLNRLFLLQADTLFRSIQQLL